MPIEGAIITWVHLVSAAIWVGGGIFLGAVLAPVLKHTSLSLEERIGLMIRVGRRFNMIGVPALGVLIVTGIYTSRGLLSHPNLLLESSYGVYLTVKMILVVAVIITYVVHVRMINRSVEEKIMSKELSEAQVQRVRRKIIVLGELVAVMSVAILFFAALLDAGV